MSRTPVWCELVCAGCASTTAGRFTYTTIQRREMVVEAKQRGWQFVFDDCYCKRCYNEQRHLSEVHQPAGSEEDDPLLGGERK